MALGFQPHVSRECRQLLDDEGLVVNGTFQDPSRTATVDRFATFGLDLGGLT